MTKILAQPFFNFSKVWYLDTNQIDFASILNSKGGEDKCIKR
ncbi:hypothetical protein' [Enterococcus faecium]|nr:hypothetical protein' [Enterococcus faecium]